MSVKLTPAVSLWREILEQPEDRTQSRSDVKFYKPLILCFLVANSLTYPVCLLKNYFKVHINIWTESLTLPILT